MLHLIKVDNALQVQIYRNRVITPADTKVLNTYNKVRVITVITLPYSYGYTVGLLYQYAFL